MTEVSQEAIDKIAKRLDALEPAKLPFNNMFGGDKYRVVVPFKDKKQEAIIKQLEEKGYRIDPVKEIAFKKIATQRGEKETAIKIGKVIARELGPEALRQWTNTYAIIITRHPTDILKMSDWKHIRSCHSEGGSYWHCAIGEAKNGGMIAYLIKKNDLEKIPDLQASEVFSDKDREIKGITPVSRLRIRRFSKGSVDLAVPEKRVYGTDSKEFKKAVLAWSRKTQEEVMDTRHHSKDMQLKGGDYEDTDKSELFNALYDDNADESDDSIKEQYRAEMVDIDNAFNNFTNPIHASYDEHDEDDYYGGVYFYWDAMVSFTFPAERFLSAYDKIDYNIRSELNRALSSEMGVNIEDLNIHHDYNNKSSIRVDLSVSDNDGGGHPDEYRDFLRELESVDENYFKHKKFLNDLLVDKGIMEPTEFSTKAQAFLDTHEEDVWHDTFKNFQVSDDNWNEEGVLYLLSNDDVQIGDLKGIDFNKIDRNLTGRYWNIDLNPYGLKRVLTVFDNFVNHHGLTGEKQWAKQPWLFPTMSSAYPKPVSASVPVSGELKMEDNAESRSLYLRIWLEVKEEHGTKALEHTINKLHLLDANFFNLMAQAKQVFNQIKQTMPKEVPPQVPPSPQTLPKEAPPPQV